MSLPCPAKRQRGTFEYAVNWLVDHEADLSVFDARYRNDDTGASAYHPSVLLKVVLRCAVEAVCTGPQHPEAAR